MNIKEAYYIKESNFNIHEFPISLNDQFILKPGI